MAKSKKSASRKSGGEARPDAATSRSGAGMSDTRDVPNQERASQPGQDRDVILDDERRGMRGEGSSTDSEGDDRRASGAGGDQDLLSRTQERRGDGDNVTGEGETSRRARTDDATI